MIDMMVEHIFINKTEWLKYNKIAIYLMDDL